MKLTSLSVRWTVEIVVIYKSCFAEYAFSNRSLSFPFARSVMQWNSANAQKGCAVAHWNGYP